MSKRKEINIDTWKRKSQYQLFTSFDHPYLTVTANVDAKKLYDYCKQNNYSFFLAYIHIANLVTNSIPEFKLRIDNGKLFEYEIIHASPTIARANETFGFAYFKTSNSFKEFHETSTKEIERIKKESDLELKPHLNLIYYSVLPNLSFTSIQHPDNHNISFSIPKIVFGKLLKNENEMLMPIAVSANHALVDGFHISKFFEVFQNLIDDCQSVLDS